MLSFLVFLFLFFFLFYQFYELKVHVGNSGNRHVNLYMQ